MGGFTAEQEAMAKPDPEFEAAGMSYVIPSHEADIQQFVKKLPVPPKFGSDIPQMRARLADVRMKIAEAAGSGPANVAERDLSVEARDGYEIPVRIYSPKAIDGAAKPDAGPLILVFHGGGFCIGGIHNEEMNCRNLVAQLGATCVNVDYRLAPEHKFPTAVNDAWDVLLWATKNTGDISADPTKGFIVTGASAGGQISMLLTHLARDARLNPPITGAALLVPVVFDAFNPPARYKERLVAYEQNADAPVLDMALVKLFLENYAYDGASKLFTPFAGPEAEWDFSGLPPTVFYVCGLDPLRDDAIVYEEVLREKGVKTKVMMYPGLPHGFWSFAPMLQSSKKIAEDLVDGVKWLLE